MTERAVSSIASVPAISAEVTIFVAIVRISAIANKKTHLNQRDLSEQKNNGSRDDGEQAEVHIQHTA